MRRVALLSLAAALLIAPATAAAQEAPAAPGSCGEYEGIVCHGWFSDDANVVNDDAAVEAAIAALVGRYGNEIAIVTVTASPHGTPLEFANDLANAWGVGNAATNNGIMILVDVTNHRTEMTTGTGVPGLDYTRITGAGNSFFGRGDFDSGIIAIIGSLEQALAAAGTGTDGSTPGTSGDGGGAPGGLVAGALAAAALVGGGVGLAAARGKRRERITRERTELIDGDVAALDPAGQELPLVSDYAIPFQGTPPPATTGSVLAALDRLGQGVEPDDPEAMTAAWAAALIAVVDRDRLLATTEVPLELRISSEQPILEGALQATIASAVDAAESDEVFATKRQELQRIVASLRPHRVAYARYRIGQTIDDRLVKASVGWALRTDDGDRFVEAGPALDAAADLAASVAELDGVYATARSKAARLETLYEKLPASTTRPAVAAALADISDDVDSSFLRYEAIRQELESRGDLLSRDGLSIPAVAALLLMNNDGDDVTDFVAAYGTNRGRGIEPDTAVEYALAGLTSQAEIARVRQEADRLGLPIALTSALLNRRADGPDVYQQLADELPADQVSGDTRRTIAAILAVSLEPAQAIRRWTEARTALTALGLVGAYADVAAAFGASDPRGPRTFALAYAAQRQALMRSSIDDADRFAPELAHEGTSGQVDTWSGSPIPRGLGTFDPYTLLFYHWVITKGHRGSYGWEPVYRDSSWSHDSRSWWGGGGTFGSGGGAWSGGSSWGGSWSGGSFGGFGGGGGFSGGGGSGW
jgi:hypothetical protein